MDPSIEYRNVKQFHEKFCLEVPTKFTFAAPDVHEFRTNFLREEASEYRDSCKAVDLATAFDSLIDLAYVCIGTALFHGISEDKFISTLQSLEKDFEKCHERGFVINVHKFTDPFYHSPRFLTPEENARYTWRLFSNISDYVCFHRHEQKSGVIMTLGVIYLNSRNGATAMGLPPQGWDEMWEDVQRANMSKERVLRAEDSKRGSTWDVRKPEGWVPPRTEEILEKYLETVR